MRLRLRRRNSDLTLTGSGIGQSRRILQLLPNPRRKVRHFGDGWFRRLSLQLRLQTLDCRLTFFHRLEQCRRRVRATLDCRDEVMELATFLVQETMGRRLFILWRGERFSDLLLNCLDDVVGSTGLSNSD